MKMNPQTQSFSYRVAGVVAHEAKILFHRLGKENYWVLPGGGCQFGENSVDTLVREFREELGATISVGRLLWIVENFYPHEGRAIHEILLVYETALTGDARRLAQREQFLGFEANPRLAESHPAFSFQFRWIPLTSITTLDLRPAVMKTELLSLPPVTRHLVNRDRA